MKQHSISINPLKFTDKMPVWQTKINASISVLEGNITSLYNGIHLDPDKQIIGDAETPIKSLSTNSISIYSEGGSTISSGSDNPTYDLTFYSAKDKIRCGGVAVTADNRTVAYFSTIQTDDIVVKDKSLNLGTVNDPIEIELNGSINLNGHVKYGVDEVNVEGLADEAFIINEATKGLVYFRGGDNFTVVIDESDVINPSGSSSSSSSGSGISTSGVGMSIKFVCDSDNTITFSGINLISNDGGSNPESGSIFNAEKGKLYEFVVIASDGSGYTACIK